MSKRSVKFLILGSGPTGLGAAYRLRELGEASFLILDQGDRAGGLAASFVDDKGFTWDIGGHVQFSHYRYFDDLMLKALGSDGWMKHERESWAWMNGRFVPYPVQNNIRHFPKDKLWACLQGLIEIQKKPLTASKDFREWIMQRFGQGLADEFMFPYNFKVWAYPTETMAANWVGERVAQVDLARVLKNILDGKDDVSWGPNATFQFPKHGGTGAIWESVAKLVGMEHIQLRATVQSVDSERKLVRLASGEEITYEHLLSTIPLDQFVAMVSPELSPSVREAAEKLVYSSSNIVGVGLMGAPPETLRTKCWMYFPENDCPFYRVTVFSNYSPNNVPDIKTTWSLMTETSESSVKPVDQKQLVEETIQGLINTRQIESRDQVVSTWTYRAHHGYPTPFLGRDAVLKTIHGGLEPKGLYSRGRFGGWKYEVSNQDHSLMQGVEWVNRICLNVPETTYPFPETANAMWGLI